MSGVATRFSLRNSALRTLLAAGFALPALGVPVMIGLSALLAGAPGLAGSRVRALREAGLRDER